MSEDLAGNAIGKYSLNERIGRGGMAEVYKAYHANLDRFVALKILHPFLGEDPQFKERFEQEARNVAQLRNPHIVQVYDFDIDTKRELYYMVMEYIDGDTLRSRLTQYRFQEENFSLPESVRVASDLATALAYAHSRSMIHRDLKPSNIMFDSDERVVLTDFGIARIVSGPNVTASGSMIGTPAYMSPEQGLGQSGDHRSDIYSLGIVLYEMVTGTTPFNADTPIAVVLKHVNDPLPAPSSLNPEIPEGLERVLYKALAKSPEERYQETEEMLAHLRDLNQASSIAIPPSTIGQSVYYPGTGEYGAPIFHTGTGYPALAEEPRRRGCLGWLMMLLALVAMAAGIYLSYTGILGNYLPTIASVGVELTDTPLPTATIPPTQAEPTAIVSPTPDVAATSIRLTVEALAAAITQPPGIEPTPNLTATLLACDYDYEILEQNPEAGSPYPELTGLTKRIVIINDSLCPLDDDTRLVFVEGEHLEGPDFIEFNEELSPGEPYEIVLNLRTPAYDVTAPVVSSTWRVILPDGTQIGPLLTFEHTIFASN